MADKPTTVVASAADTNTNTNTNTEAENIDNAAAQSSQSQSQSPSSVLPTEQTIGSSSATSTADTDNAEAEAELNPEFTIMHPLNSMWVLWFDGPAAGGGRNTVQSWADKLKKVKEFGTVEDFWCLWKHITSPNKLSPGSTYHLFREGIRPEWEDKRNARGGKWTLTLPKNRRNKLGELWLNLVLEIIGESMVGCDEVNGAVVCIRKQADRIAVWTRSTAENAAVKELGERIKSAIFSGEIQGNLPNGPDFTAHTVALQQAHAAASPAGDRGGDRRRHGYNAPQGQGQPQSPSGR